MDMKEEKWNGARWRKFDFHAHTPASDDYGKGENQAALQNITPKEWLLDYMRAGIDCVAVTDHNSGAWIDKLKETLIEMESEQVTGFRPIYLFPGVEISAHGGVHLLAILGRDKITSNIDSLLDAVGYPTEKRGTCDAVTTKSLVDIVDAVVQAGGILIPAHADEEKGLFTLSGQTLIQALESDNIFAIEVVDSQFTKPPAYSDKKLNWTEVLGSDSHHPSGSQTQTFPGSRYTWIKMGEPKIEGLRLALLDGRLSVRRSDQADEDLNQQHAQFTIENIKISDAHFIGHARPFSFGFSPWLNAVIGGRGTGKSTLIEFIRLALRREGELPDELKPEFEKYRSVYSNRDDTGLLTQDTTIQVAYRKNDTKYRIQWSASGDVEPIQEYVEGEWRRAEGEIQQRFPVRIYSQKQIFQLAKKPLALLRIIDEASEVARRSWDEQWREEEARFLSLRAKAREIEAGLAEEPRLRGELDDVMRKLSIFEKAGHADVLKTFQKRSRQSRAVEAWEESWSNAGDRLREIADALVPDPLDEATFNSESPEEIELIATTSAVRKTFETIRDNLKKLADKADETAAEWQNQRDLSGWKQAVDSARTSYNDLLQKLAIEGVGDPATYGELVQRRQLIEQRLKNLIDRRKQIDDLKSQSLMSFSKLQELRRKLTEVRRKFLDKVLSQNRYVNIQVKPYVSSKESVEREFRGLIQREDGRFDKDIGSPGGEGLLGKLYADTRAEGMEKALDDLKNTVRDIAKGQYDPSNIADARFTNHIAKLTPEALDRLDLWFPEDSLDVRYSATADGDHFHSIQEGSPGQKTAALLAFLLSYGDEPLILDQPEDDLDNHLIYDLIVTQLRESKQRRQVIVVTHNPNIVVHGDAELVVAFAVRGGETQKECEGCLQEKQVRDTICSVMEGGRDAFEQRYRRIALGGRRV
jgi:predicted ATPase/PHP family Zn ribbon phosphoesterase